jgi:peptide/nickel transport system permease protein
MSEATMTIEMPASPSKRTRGGQFYVAWRRLKRDRVFHVAAGIAIAIALCALFAPLIATHDPEKTSMLARLRPIGSPGHLLGTDELGRDLFSRLVYGGRLSLAMALIPVTIAFVVGSALGIIAGFAGGRTNTLIMRSMDVFFAFPSVLLAVAISGALGASLTNVAISLVIVFVPPICRVAESATTQISRLEYVDAARISGAKPLRIITRHLLANMIGPVFVYASSLISVSIILASGLSFLGLGVKPPAAEWGVMLNTLRSAIYVQPWVAALPGLLIFVTSICFNLISDSIREAMDLKS